MITPLRIAKLPPGRSLAEPATAIVTFFGVGLLPLAPGSWGSLVALPFGVALSFIGGWPLLLLAAAVTAYAGWRAGDIYVTQTGREDPPEIVIDEVATQWMVMTVVPMTLAGLLAAFLVFRICDTLKPWPASWADSDVEGGAGIMLDDLIAGIYAILLLLPLVWSGAL